MLYYHFPSMYISILLRPTSFNSELFRKVLFSFQVLEMFFSFCCWFQFDSTVVQEHTLCGFSSFKIVGVGFVFQTVVRPVCSPGPVCCGWEGWSTDTEDTLWVGDVWQLFHILLDFPSSCLFMFRTLILKFPNIEDNYEFAYFSSQNIIFSHRLQLWLF